MKKILFLLYLGFTTFTVASQNLTLAQLLEVRKKDLGNAEEFLTLKGWELLSAEEPSSEQMGSATFTYNKDNMSDRAESFLTYLYSDYSQKARLSIQINKKLKYTEYINSIKALGCKLLSSKIEDGRIIKVYRGATTTFEVSSGTSTNFYNEATAVWYLLITTNEDYDLNWGE